MPCSPINTSGPVNPGRQADRLTGRQVNTNGLPIILCSPIFDSGPVKPGSQVNMLTGRQVNKNGLPIIPCSPIFVLHLSTRVDRLTGRHVDNKRVDRIRGKYMIARDYG